MILGIESYFHTVILLPMLWYVLLNNKKDKLNINIHSNNDICLLVENGSLLQSESQILTSLTLLVNSDNNHFSIALLLLKSEYGSQCSQV